MTDIVELISNLGFPIACVLLLGYFVKYQYDNNLKQMETLTSAINQLTLVVSELKLMLEKKEDD